MGERFIIEGTWSGYTSAQSRVVHRTVHHAAFKRLRAWCEATHGIRYTDGTMLYLSVRDAKPRERVKEERGYASLIEECAHFGVDSVDALQLAKKAAQEEGACQRAAQATGETR